MSLLMMVVLSGCTFNVHLLVDNENVITPKVADNEIDKRLKELVDSYAQNRGFSGVVLVMRGNETILEASYGRADIEWNVPNSLNARYQIGSLSKPVATVTVAQLLSHTSGIKDISRNLN